MLQLHLESVGKQFYQRWVFRQINLAANSGQRIALTGGNGSGKSTLMRIIAGQLSPTEGRAVLSFHGKRIAAEDWYRHLSWSGPYTSLYTDLSLREHIQLHFRFRDCIFPNPMELCDWLQLGPHADKKLRYYSSGMLQRVKTGLAIATRADLLLLDEPTSNMDERYADLVLEGMNRFSQDRLVVLASNLPREYHGFSQRLALD